jgi:2,3-bisphosphoglycerate-independent phosphoglycerate mutase
MSADELADRFVAEIAGGYAFAVINFANPDMVGHTGVIPAVVKAVETADACLGKVVDAVRERRGVCLITADHGNAEQMLEADGVSPLTSHTTNLVPLILSEKGLKLREMASSTAPTAPRCSVLPSPTMEGRNLWLTNNPGIMRPHRRPSLT